MSLELIAVLGDLRKMRCVPGAVLLVQFGKVCRIVLSGESCVVTSGVGGVPAP